MTGVVGEAGVVAGIGLGFQVTVVTEIDFCVGVIIEIDF